MNRCRITMEEIPEGARYSRAGLKRLDARLMDLQLLPYTLAQQLEEAAARADKMSVQGVQPKLSAVLRVKENRFEVVDRSGRFILKPCPPHWPEVPANEALTMTLAEHSGIEVPVHGLVEATDGSMVYFIRRFDRVGQGERLPLEDGAQLLGHTRDTKYDSSMEQVIGMIEEYCTFPVIEKRKLMQRVWFSFLTGNEDMHLKNWSLLSREGRVALSPAYDLLNSSIVLKNPQEETALPIRGRKRNLNRRDLLDYLAVERCGLPPDMMRSDLEALLLKAGTDWPTWINRSFLSEQKLEAYLNLVRERVARLQDHKA
jgi:serine/threonine-protein kinase HipA